MVVASIEKIGRRFYSRRKRVDERIVFCVHLQYPLSIMQGTQKYRALGLSQSELFSVKVDDIPDGTMPDVGEQYRCRVVLTYNF